MSFRFKIKNSHVPSITLNQFWWPYAIIIVLVTLVYFPTFSGKFILDDNSLVRNNPYVKRLHPITSYLAQEDGITDRRDAGSYHTGYYRPLINVTYWLDYTLWGMSAPGFRTTNLILHLLSCLLLFKVLVSLVNDRHACFFSAALFALHPVNTESVSWIVSRNNILVTLFAIASFYFYLKSLRKDSYAALAFSILFFVAAILSKEFGLMVLPVFFLYHRLLYKEKGNVLKELTSYVPFLLIVIFYFMVRNGVTSSLLTPSELGQVWSRVYFSPYLIVLSLKLILLPYGLHSFGLSYPSNFLDLPAVLSLVLFLLLGTALWFKRNNKVLIFSGLSFLVTLFPVLNIIPTASISLLAMRWLYLPFAFLSVSVAWLIQKAIVRRKMLTTSLLCACICYLGVYSYTLNKNLWHDEDTFFTQEVKEFNNHLYAGGLAESLLDKRRYYEAEEYFCLAIEHYPNEVKNHINYSALLIETDRAEKALFFLNKARSLTMTHNERGQWLNNMGMAYFKLGNDAEALKSFRKAILFCPNEPEFWANLGAVYGYLGDYENSVLVLKRALEIAPESISLRKNLAVTYLRMGNPAMALSTLESIPQSQRAEMDVIQLVNEARRILKLNERTD
jgi:Flp pilus assembly protein TadD